MHDLYLTTSIETLGRDRTIIALQHYAARAYQNAQTALRLKSFDHLTTAANFQSASAWASLNARILMGVEE